jgi:hypothetical protein
MVPKEDTLAKAMDKAGLEEGRSFPPFLELASLKAGDYFIGTIHEGVAAEWVPKKGKNKGKKQKGFRFVVDIDETNKPDLPQPSITLSVQGGLLGYQLADEQRPKGVKLPCTIGFIYKGRDEEERHQTEIRWPKAKAA